MSKHHLHVLQAILTCALAAVGLLAILILYRQMSRIGEEEVLQSLNQTAEQTVINLNERMLSINDALQSLLNDSRFQESIQRPSDAETLETQLGEIRPMREALASAEENRFITQIRIYMNNQKMLTREGVNFFGLQEVADTEEYQTMVSRQTTHLWLGVHPVKTLYFHENCITLAQIYRSSYRTDSPNWAVVLFDVLPTAFSDVLDGLGTPDDRDATAVVNSAGQVMFGSGDEALFSEIISRGREQEPGLFRFSEVEYAYVTHPLKIEDWSLVMYIPRDGLLNERQTIRQVLPIMIFGLTLLIIAMIVILALAIYSWRINAYIRTLHNNLRTQQEPMKLRTPVHSMLFNLDQSIGELLETNKQLTEEKLKAQLRERDVTLQALQAQINPHFLYNTLDSINWMAIRAQASEVSEAIMALADYFRISLSRGQSVVPLKDDAEIARKYLLLYQYRSDYDFQVKWKLNENTLLCDLPKLTLQPLIENALHHGIFKRSEKTGGTVIIRSVLDGDMLILTVSDNGPGIEKGVRWEQGYGLSNVRKRLDLYFNNRYEMNLANNDGEGATVTVKVRP